MIKNVPAFAGILAILLFTSLSASSQTKYSRVAIRIPQTELASLHKMGLEFDHGAYDTKTQQFITTLSSEDLLLLKKSSYAFKILIDDETANFIQQNKDKDFYEADRQGSKSPLPFGNNNCVSVTSDIVTPADFTQGSMGGYLTLAEINAKIDLMISKYPGLVRKDTIGYSFEHRPLIVIKISDNVNKDEDEPEFFLHSLQHAREPEGMMQLLFFMQYVLENYSKDISVKQIVDNREMFFMLCFNPDGYEYNRSTNPNGGGMHRKNRNNTNGAVFNIGTDLNRNYGVDWGYDNIGSSPDAESDTYRGATAFSEPELQAVRNFVNSRKFILHVDYHTYSNVFIYPYGVPKNHNPQPEDEKKFYGYSKTVLPRHNFFGVGTAPETVGYSVNGVSSDWYVAGDLDKRSKVYSYAAEIGSGLDGFWPAKNRILPLAKEQLWHNFQLAYMAGSYFDIQDISPVSIANKTGNFSSAVITQTGLTPAPMKISIIPLQNIASVGATLGLPAEAYLQSETIKISYTLNANIKNGQTVKFVWKITSGGIDFYDTITKIYRPNVLLADNMEGSFSTNWSTTGQWNFSTNKAYKGTHSLHDASGALYANNANNIVTCNKVFDLTNAKAAYLSFYTLYKSENGYDKMTAEISTSGAAGPFTPLCGKQTVTENFGSLAQLPSYTGSRLNWSREIIDLSAYNGKNNIVIRFHMTSDGFTNDEGFYIDDIELVKTPVPPALQQSGITQSASVMNDDEVSLQLSPNPAKDIMFAQWNESKSGSIRLSITDNTGRIVYSRVQNVIAGINKISISTEQFVQGVYLLKIDNGTESITGRFYKE